MTDAPDTPPTDDELAALADVLDAIVPPSADGRMPGAGELGLAAELARLPDVAPLVRPGLEALEALARDAGHDGWRAVPAAGRKALLEATAATQPAFLPTLLARTLVAYYQQPSVLDLVGIGAGPLFPRGFDVPPTDFSILDPVRQRAPIYRVP